MQYSGINEILEASKAINEYFDKVYVLTLKRASDRHQFIEKSLIGLDYEFVYGVDKKEHPDVFLLSQYDDELTRKNKLKNSSIRLSEIAISLSHRKVYQKIIDDNVQRALVFEDDAFFIEKKAFTVKQILGELPSDWDCVYFGYLGNEHEKFKDKINKEIYLLLRSLGLYKFNKKQIINRFPRPYSKHLMHAGRHDCIHALGVSNKAAKILVENQTPIQYGPDPLIASLSGKELIKSFITVPKVFDQLSFGSGVESEIKTMNQ